MMLRGESSAFIDYRNNMLKAKSLSRLTQGLASSSNIMTVMSEQISVAFDDPMPTDPYSPDLKPTSGPASESGEDQIFSSRENTSETTSLSTFLQEPIYESNGFAEEPSLLGWSSDHWMSYVGALPIGCPVPPMLDVETFYPRTGTNIRVRL